LTETALIRKCAEGEEMAALLLLDAGADANLRAGFSSKLGTKSVVNYIEGEGWPKAGADANLRAGHPPPLLLYSI
jgi:hypothetical protein